MSHQDIDLKYKTLCFINMMLLRAPDEKRMAKFVARLETLGIYDQFRQLAKVDNKDVIKQL